MSWKILDSGKKSAQENMQQDARLLDSLAHCNHSFLHFYEWESDSATFGYFVDPAKYLSMQEVEARNLTLARRPTGGGIVFHQCDWAFSILVHHTHPFFSSLPLENYNFINNKIIEAITRFQGRALCSLLPTEPTLFAPLSRHFCMAKPTKYDVMIEGKKVGGAAQRKTRFGYLHQGTISLGMLPEEYLRSLLLPGSGVFEEMQRNTYSLLGATCTLETLHTARETMKSLLTQVFMESL